VEIRTYRLTLRSKIAVTVVTLLVLGAGALLLAFGLALLAGVAAAGVVLGAGTALWRRLRGPRVPLPPGTRQGRAGLDPSKEVFLPPEEPR
jgi:hypothetical protein